MLFRNRNGRQFEQRLLRVCSRVVLLLAVSQQLWQEQAWAPQELFR
jgi:hypothetical protein